MARHPEAVRAKILTVLLDQGRHGYGYRAAATRKIIQNTAARSIRVDDRAWYHFTIYLPAVDPDECEECNKRSGVSLPDARRVAVFQEEFCHKRPGACESQVGFKRAGGHGGGFEWRRATIADGVRGVGRCFRHIGVRHGRDLHGGSAKRDRSAPPGDNRPRRS